MKMQRGFIETVLLVIISMTIGASLGAQYMPRPNGYTGDDVPKASALPPR